MSERPNTPAEPEDSLSRLMEGPSGPLAAAGFILGASALSMFYFTLSFGGLARRYVTTHSPPSLMAVNLSFFAIMLGVASIYRIRKLPRQGVVRTAAIMALLLGMLGPLVYSLQSLRWHNLAEAQESANIKSIVDAATAYAKSHNGNFPPNLAVLLADHLLGPDALVSPFSPHASPALPPATIAPATTDPAATAPALSSAYLKSVDDASDYEYFGSDFKLSCFDKAVSFGAEAIAVVSHRPIMGTRLAVGFADGGSTMMESTEQFAKARADNDAIREKVGLPPMGLPTVVNPATTAPSTNPAGNP